MCISVPKQEKSNRVFFSIQEYISLLIFQASSGKSFPHAHGSNEVAVLPRLKIITKRKKQIASENPRDKVNKPLSQ